VGDLLGLFVSLCDDLGRLFDVNRVYRVCIRCGVDYVRASQRRYSDRTMAGNRHHVDLPAKVVGGKSGMCVTTDLVKLK